MTSIKRNSLADEVAQRLQEQISLGTYKPGEKLPTEPALMQAYGVGRSSIREAVRILANSGVLRVQQGLGTFVEASTGIEEPFPQRIKRAGVDDLDEVRLLLEMKIAQKAAVNRTAEDIDKMEAYLKKRKEAGIADDTAGAIEADISFHVAIAEASGNSILTDLYKTVAHHLKNHFIAQFKNAESFRDSQHLHKNLLNSIIAQDAQKAWQWAQRITQHSNDEPAK
ncbi:FadR/GntR family transcriptional regulator [Chitinophaga sp. CF418]|uniref:FadR/GntR family transcriptional regulator n=1 Tax=Chitinophaga sp. CF418 TaxID=1855287 RepID=UPI00091A1316|nr:FadR/GntR family transcriptional regulator [Chitinophaga sp. CF418]SHN44935.1 DNA-binding transcriptional regulator, FadR family [Chitinophaga sp. CF418]